MADREIFVFEKIGAAELDGKAVRIHWITRREPQQYIPGGMCLVGEILPDNSIRRIAYQVLPDEVVDFVRQEDLWEEDLLPLVCPEGDEVYIVAFRESEAVAAARAAGITATREPSAAHNAWRALRDAERGEAMTS